MWDLTRRPIRWERKIERRRAPIPAEQDTPTSELAFTVHVPSELWIQLRARPHFKGEGRQSPFTSRDADVVIALGGFLLGESRARRNPDERRARIEGWTARQVFSAMMEGVIDQDRPSPTTPYKRLRGSSHGSIVDLARSDKHTPKRLYQQDPVELDEEHTINTPDPVEMQHEFNRTYVMEWLRAMSREEREDVVEKLARKFGPKVLWERMTWALYHPDFPGVQVMVEQPVR